MNTPQFGSFLKQLRLSKKTLLIFAALIGVVGVALLLFSRASTTSPSVEPELGSLSGPVAIVNDTNASGGKTVKFQPPVAPPPPSSGAGYSTLFYSATSFWNTPIAANPAIDSDSSLMVTTSLVPSAGSSNFANTDGWGIPLVFSHNTDPLYTIGCTSYGCGNTIQFHIPVGAKPTTGSDHHLAVINVDTGQELDMWVASFNGSTWTSGSRYVTDAYGWGAMCAQGQHCGGSVAAGFAIWGGIPTPEHFSGSGGYIHHALTITVANPNTRAGYVACPATSTDGKTAGNQYIPEGARIQLDPSFNVDGQSWSSWQKILAKTMQIYGAYVSDTGGSLAIRGEANINREGAWSTAGIPQGASLSWMPWGQMRILKLVQC